MKPFIFILLVSLPALVNAECKREDGLIEYVDCLEKKQDNFRKNLDTVEGDVEDLGDEDDRLEKKIDGDWQQFGLRAQMLAQATCVALNPRGGWTFAVSRDCSKPAITCAQVCEGMSDGNRTGSNAGPLMCFNSLHIYDNKPFSNHTTLGLKVYKYNNCQGGCGPNFCCCSNAN